MDDFSTTVADDSVSDNYDAQSDLGDIGQQADVGEAAAAAPAPSYSELFPPLPDADVTAAKVSQGTWAASAVRSSNIHQVFHVPVEEQAFAKADKPFGGKPQAKIIADITEKTGAKIDVSTSRDKTLAVVVSGKIDAVNAAKKMLLKQLQTQATIELPVPQAHHRVLIGRGGENLRKLMDETSTNIRIPKAEEKSDLVKIIGTTENIRKAAHRIQRISDEQANKDIIDLEVLKAYHQLVSGHKNSTIKQLEEANKVRIYVPPPSVEKNIITISGEKPGVQIAAKQIQAIYEEKKRTCGELNTPVECSQHRFVIGPKGCNISTIFEETGVVVEVPKAETKSKTITLRGPQPNLVQALTKVYEFANSIVSDEVHVPRWLHRHMIGPKGETLKKVVGVNERVHVNFGDTEEIDLEGPPEQVAAVKASITALANELQAKLAFAEVSVPRKFHPHIIGKSGQTIRKIRNETSANITMPKEDSDSEMIRVEGSPEAVAAASATIRALALKMENSKDMDLIIPVKLHSQLIGPGGSTIRELVKMFNDITIDVPNSKKESEIVCLRGNRADVDAAAAHIKKLVKRLEESNYSEKVPVFKQFHRNIIGPKGSTIKQIKDETNTRINVPSENSTDDSITIIGLKKDVEIARDRILTIQNEMASIVTEEVEIDAKLHKLMRGKIANSVSQDCGNVAIRFPSKGADKVTIRGPEEDVAKAKVQLLEIATEQAANSHSEEIKVKTSHHRHLIGRSGATMAKIQAESGARVLVPRVNDKDNDTVTVLGSEAACKKAIALINKRVEDLENTVEETVSISAEYHKHFVARRAQFLSDLSDDFGGVQITMPPKGTSEVITVKGGKEDVPLAIAHIKKFVDELKNRVTIQVEIPQEFHRSVVGAGGRNVRKVCEDFNVNVKFPDRPNRKGRGGKVPAAAPTPEADGAAAAPTPEADEGADEYDSPTFAAEDEAPVEAEAEAAADAAAEAPAAAEDAAAAPVAKAGPPKARGDFVTISGQPDDCQRAKEALLALVPITETIDVEPAYHGSIIGPKGEGLRKLMAGLDAQIKIPDSKAQSPTITLRGAKEDLDLVRERLNERIVELDADKEDRLKRSFKVELRIDPRHHSTLIGKRGETINAIRSEHDVQIDFPRRNDQESENADLIVVTGYEAQAQAAAADIEEKAKELEALATEVVEIHPDVHRRIIGFKGQNVKTMQDKYNVRINFPREKDSFDITVIGQPEDVEQVREELMLMEDEYIDEIKQQEEMKQYLKPSRDQSQSKPKNQQQKPFQVSGAPWQMAQDSFPTLGNGSANGNGNGNGATSPSRTAGPWGRKK